MLRRIAVGHQERHEAIGAPDGWLSEGHGLDLTMLATAANFETRTNGATHMGNDDYTTFDAVAHLKIIDVSCPQQMLALMSWIMDGNRGLLYVRVMRTPSAVLYAARLCSSSSARASFVHGAPDDAAFIVSSGRGVHEAHCGRARVRAIAGSQVARRRHAVDRRGPAAQICRASGKLVCLAEQNNGYILQNLLKVRHRRGDAITARTCCSGVLAINTLDRGRAAAIHSFGNVRRTDRGVRVDAVAYRVGRDRRDERARIAMTVPAIHEDDAEELGLPGRRMRWLVSNGRHQGEQLLGMRDPRRPGRKSHAGALAPERRRSDLHHRRARAACSWQAKSGAVRQGTAVLFPQGAVHMLHNTGSEEMKVVCFFAPATGLDNYRLHEGVDFPD